MAATGVDMTGWKTFTLRSPDGRVITLKAPNLDVAKQGAQIYVQRNPVTNADGLTPAAERVREGRVATWAPGRAIDASVGKDGVDAMTNSMGHNFTFGLDTDVLPGVAAGVQGIGNLIRSATGDPIQTTMGDRYAGERQALLDQLNQDHTDHPGWSIAGDVLGTIAAPGIARAGKFVGAPSVLARAIPGAGGVAKAARFAVGSAETAAKSSALGAALGAEGAEQNAPAGQRGDAAQQGAVSGAEIGAVTPAALGVVGKVGGAALDRFGKPIVNTVVRAANRATGGALLDPNATAMSRVAEAMQKDGVNPAIVRQSLNEWLKTGAPPPYLMNVGGENTRALLRAAATQGPARDAAQSFADQQAADLQPNVLARTRALTTDQRPAADVAADLKAQRSAQADADYRAPYPQPVDPSPPLTGALEGDAGKRAIATAYRSADVNRLADQRVELNALGKLVNTDPQAAADQAATGMATPPGQPNIPQGPVSLGTLDQIKQAFNNMGDQALQKPETAGLARGYYARAREIDDHLADLSPEYAAARDNYAANSRKMDALRAGDINVASDSPDAVRAAISGVAPQDADLPGVQLRQNLTDAIGAPTAGATGALNRIGTAANAGQNLATVFGPDQAASYQGAVRNLVKQVNDARFVAPNTGAKTANVALDQGLIGEPPRIPHTLFGAVATAIDKIKTGATMTDAERLALTQLGQTHASVALNTPAVPQASAPMLQQYAPAISGVFAGQDPDNQ